jgi:hypothetical protein
MFSFSFELCVCVWRFVNALQDLRSEIASIEAAKRDAAAVRWVYTHKKQKLKVITSKINRCWKKK